MHFLRVMILLGCAASGPAWAETTVIHAGHLIAEPGRPAKARQSVTVEDGKIVAVQDGYIAAAKVVELQDSWVMPGLIDMHVHITGVLDLTRETDSQIAIAYLAPTAKQVLAILPRLDAILMNGFTTIRTLGDQASATYAFRDAINAGVVRGPRIFGTEPQIEVDGGDLAPFRWGVRREAEPLVANRGSCTGVTECTKAVRVEVRRGADVIKLRQSGVAAENPRVEMMESPEEVRAIIATAHQLDRRVAAHVVGSPAFLHLVIAAGADTIEHGPLDDASIALMKKHGSAYTPTLLAAKLIDYRFKDASDGTGKAYRAGVPVLFGTDLGIFGPERSHEEFVLLAAAGLPPAEVLRAATVNAAAALGRGDSLGTIAVGKIADIVAMKVDPLQNLDALGKPGAMTFIMKQGKIERDAR